MAILSNYQPLLLQGKSDDEVSPLRLPRAGHCASTLNILMPGSHHGCAMAWPGKGPECSMLPVQTETTNAWSCVKWWGEGESTHPAECVAPEWGGSWAPQ